ncbi:MAG: JmjC domain-containing protein [Actinomycetes bacterium]
MSATASDATATLTRCVGDPQHFVDHVWGRRSQVHASGVPASDLLGLDDLDTLLTSSALRIPTFRLVKDGAPLPPSAYTTSGTIGGRRYDGVAAPAKVLAAMDDGATLVLQGAHRYHAPLALLARHLELALGHRCQVNAYVTPPGARGLEVHSDPHDVLVLQAFGSKTWEVHPTPWEAEHRSGAAPVEQVLRPGDVQYLPKGTPHAARSQDLLSAHVTVGIVGTTWSDVVSEVVESLLSDETTPAGWLDDPQPLAAQLAQRLEQLRSDLASVDVEDVITRRAERFLSTRPSLLVGALLDRQVSVCDDTPLARRPGSVLRVASSAAPGRLRLLLGDRVVDVPGWLRPAVDAVAAADRLTPADLAPHLDAQSRVVLCRRLVREGVLRVAASR